MLTPTLEPLEARFVLATITPTVTGTNVTLAWTGTTTSPDNVVLSVSSGTYTFNNTASTNTITVGTNSAITITNNGTDDVMVAAATGFTVTGITFADGNVTGGNTYDIESADVPTTVSTLTGSGTDDIDLAATSGVLSGIIGNVSINYSGSIQAAVAISDINDTTATSPAITATNITGLAPATISYSLSSMSSLTVSGGSGGNHFIIAGNPPGTFTTIDTGSGDDSVTVLGSQLATGTNSGVLVPPTLAIDGQGGTNTLTINPQGTTATITPSSPTAGTVSFGTGTSLSYTNFSTAQLTPSPISAQGVDIFPTLNTSYTATPIATFQDSSGALPASSYTVTVNWGDGHTTTVPASDLTLVGTTYEVNASHTFGSLGTFTVLTTVTNNSTGASAIATGTATVAPLALVAGTFTPSTSPIPVTTGTALALSATFTNGAAPLPAVSDYTATINWGDGSPATPGTVTLAGTTFTVAGSHAYAQSGTDTISITIGIAGQTLLITTTATVSAPNIAVSSSITVPLAVTAGTGTGSLTVATITPVTGAPNPDPTSYTAVIDWGDGSTVTDAVISSPSAGTLDVNTSGHTYGNPGSYTAKVVVSDAQGYLIGSTSFSVTADSLTVTPSTTLAPSAGVPTGSLTVGTLSATPSPATTAYTAIVDWGDGSTPVNATVASGTSGALNVNTSGHTYAQGGTYTLGISVFDAQGYQVGTATESVTVSAVLTDGKLSPQSDTGISNTDGITSNTTPTFVGTTSPGTTVQVFAAAAGATLPGTLIAAGVGNGSGVWTATTYTPLTDGSYTVTAEAVNSAGTVLATDTIGTVVIDTVGPIINSVSFDRGTATMTITFQDNLSGLDYASITNSAFYHLSAKPLSKKVPVKRYVLPTSITVTSGGTGTTLETVAVQFYQGRLLRGGLYTLVVDSGNNDNGIQDVAGNAMDGNYYGAFPTGDGLPGGNFVALIPAFHNKVLHPMPIKDGRVPPVSTPGTQPVSTLISDPPPATKTTKAVALVRTSSRNLAAQAARSQGAQPAAAVAQPTQTSNFNDLAMEALVLDDTSTTTHHSKK